MAITDELREYIEKQIKWLDMTKVHYRNLFAIADRIDEAHEHSIEEQEQAHNFAYSQVYEFASGIYGQLLDFDKMDEQQDAMAANGWVKLPVDADGVTIHVGERVQLIGNDPSTVSHMSLADDGWRVYVKYDGGIGTGSGEPKLIHHYHAPTVEDVLREMADRCYADEDEPRDRDAIVAEYAAKLRLTGDGK